MKKHDNPNRINFQPKTPEERISAVAQRWFLTEPLYFAMYCTHTLKPNPYLQTVAMRCGEHKLEYSPQMVDALSDYALADWMKLEMLRVVLKHPYQRQPYRPRLEILYLASTIAILMHMGGPKAFCIDVVPEDLYESLPEKLTFEEYYQLLDRLFPPEDTPEEIFLMGQGAALWGEDSLFEAEINQKILLAMQGSLWGSIPGDMVSLIKASTVPPINIANVLKHFKKTVMSQKRTLTRMRPSRRYGLEQMGSRYTYNTGVLVAVDVSGSVDDFMLSKMLGTINRIFKQGVEKLDVVQFDAELKLPVMPINKAINKFKVLGRGGTSFQPAADYYMEHPEYDGLIIITDGGAPEVEVPEVYAALPVSWIIIDGDHLPQIYNGWHGWHNHEND